MQFIGENYIEIICVVILWFERSRALMNIWLNCLGFANKKETALMYVKKSSLADKLELEVPAAHHSMIHRLNNNVIYIRVSLMG